MCAAELTWYTLKVYNWVLMKHTWWNWHAVPGTAYWNMGHAAGTLRKIGIYFIWRNNWHIDVPWNISKIFYWISFFSVQHMVSILNCMIFCIDYHANCTYCELMYLIGTYWHCARVWYWSMKIVEHSLDFHLRSCKHFDGVENVSGKYFFFYWYRILFWHFEICIISLFSFGWWYTLMENKY